MTATAPTWFPGWVEHHCRATAAPAGTAAALDLAADFLAGDDRPASEIELLECTRRLVAGRRAPRFANEHVEAVAIELAGMRQAVARDAATVREAAAVEPCDWCRDTGTAIVPHPQCVRNGGLVPHPVNGRVATCGVSCRCDRGQAVWSAADARHTAAKGENRVGIAPPMKLVNYESLVCGHWESLMREITPPRTVRADTSIEALRAELRDFFVPVL